MNRAASAPIFSDCFTLTDWLLDRLDRTSSVLAHTLCRNALTLLDHVLLALKNIDRQHHIDSANQLLIRLRIQLRLAASIDLLSESQSLHALGIANRIGRQLGGWQRSLEAA